MPERMDREKVIENVLIEAAERDATGREPRLYYGLRSFVVERDEENGRTLLGGLGGLGVGQMWVEESDEKYRERLEREQ